MGMIEGQIRNSASFNASFNGDKARENHLSLLVAVVGPFLAAFSLGFLFGLAIGVSAGFSTWNWRIGLKWGAIAGAWSSFVFEFIFIGLWWWMRIRLEEELGWNLSVKSKLKKELTVVMSDGQGHMTRQKMIGLDDETKLVKFARDMIANPNQSTAQDHWCSGPDRVFTKPEYIGMVKFFFDNHMGDWNSSVAHARGWHFTNKGWAYLRYLANGTFNVRVVDATPTLPHGLSREEFKARYGENAIPFEKAA